MSGFNNNSRTDNALKTSVVGGASQIIKVLLGFGYRTLFLHYLTAAYLGINGLFANVLQVLSLAELGVTTSIVYRFYEPINRGDVQYVGRLMNFFRRVYLMIAAVILSLGLIIMPFIKYFIKDASEVPADVNLYLIYVLFLANTLSSYLFTYKLSLLTADQRHYSASLINLVVTFLQYSSQIIILYITKNYTLTLAAGIAATILTNYLFSIWVTKQYKDVFSVKEMLPKEERSKIYKDTRACMYHKVGYTVLTGTDNVVLTKMVSLVATGLYSNYSLIITNIQQVFYQLLGNFISSVANARNNMTNEEYYNLYKRINFVCLWFSSIIVVTCCISIDDLIRVWLGEQYVLSNTVTVSLCILLYISITRTINNVFVNADGLFVRDRVRPLIEAVINLVVSIVLTQKYGIIGVFIGTIVSGLVTFFWREPLLIYRHSFHKQVSDYWKRYLGFFVISAAEITVLFLMKQLLISHKLSLLFVIIEAICSFCFSNVVLLLVFHDCEEFKYLTSVVRSIFSRFFSKQKKQ